MHLRASTKAIIDKSGHSGIGGQDGSHTGDDGLHGTHGNAADNINILVA